MRFIPNAGNDRVIDVLTPALELGSHLDLATSELSLYAFAELMGSLSDIDKARLLLPETDTELHLLGADADRHHRNQLRNRWLADELLAWLETKAEVRDTASGVPQGLVVIRDGEGHPLQGITGSFSFSTGGLGTAPGNPMSLVQGAESEDEARALAEWFDRQWATLSSDPAAKKRLVEAVARISAPQSPTAIYALILHHLLGTRDGDLDEDRVVNAATGIRDTVVWRKLYKFQRDGVVGAIEKLNRFGGCIIADSVGLGKTFEALAIIKYFELRNDRVLVLCPKRLRDNWTIYAANDRRNILASDRFNYDVLNHTDLSRHDGLSGDIDLAHVNWGNYDLVVIDESHNFRNKRTPKKGGETRYDRSWDPQPEDLQEDRTKRKLIVGGIKYKPLGDDGYYAQELFTNEELTGYLRNMLLDAEKSVYDAVIYDSHIEEKFAQEMEKNNSVKVYAKLPSWFRIPTPLGDYNPDWAVLVDTEDGERLYFVVETKGSTDQDSLRITEEEKIHCGRRHFEAISSEGKSVDYHFVSTLDELLSQAL